MDASNAMRGPARALTAQETLQTQLFMGETILVLDMSSSQMQALGLNLTLGMDDLDFYTAVGLEYAGLNFLILERTNAYPGIWSVWVDMRACALANLAPLAITEEAARAIGIKPESITWRNEACDARHEAYRRDGFPTPPQRAG